MGRERSSGNMELSADFRPAHYTHRIIMSWTQVRSSHQCLAQVKLPDWIPEAGKFASFFSTISNHKLVSQWQSSDLLHVNFNTLSISLILILLSQMTILFILKAHNHVVKPKLYLKTGTKLSGSVTHLHCNRNTNHSLHCVC